MTPEEIRVLINLYKLGVAEYYPFISSKKYLHKLDELGLLGGICLAYRRIYKKEMRDWQIFQLSVKSRYNPHMFIPPNTVYYKVRWFKSLRMMQALSKRIDFLEDHLRYVELITLLK